MSSFNQRSTLSVKSLIVLLFVILLRMIMTNNCVGSVQGYVFEKMQMVSASMFGSKESDANVIFVIVGSMRRQIGQTNKKNNLSQDIVVDVACIYALMLVMHHAILAQISFGYCLCLLFVVQFSVGLSFVPFVYKHVLYAKSTHSGYVT